jgi:hypothetical protein
MSAEGSSNIKFCDFDCPDADFPKDTDVDGAGSCRTFAAVWCRKLGEYTTKNAPCAAERRKAQVPPPA